MTLYLDFRSDSELTTATFHDYVLLNFVVSWYVLMKQWSFLSTCVAGYFKTLVSNPDFRKQKQLLMGATLVRCNSLMTKKTEYSITWNNPLKSASTKTD